MRMYALHFEKLKLPEMDAHCKDLRFKIRHEMNTASSTQSHCYKVCPMCGTSCIQPPGHGGQCRCENNHEGYW